MLGEIRLRIGVVQAQVVEFRVFLLEGTQHVEDTNEITRVVHIASNHFVPLSGGLGNAVLALVNSARDENRAGWTALLPARPNDASNILDDFHMGGFGVYEHAHVRRLGIDAFADGLA